MQFSWGRGFFTIFFYKKTWKSRGYLYHKK